MSYEVEVSVHRITRVTADAFLDQVAAPVHIQFRRSYDSTPLQLTIYTNDAEFSRQLVEIITKLDEERAAASNQSTVDVEESV